MESVHIDGVAFARMAAEAARMMQKEWDGEEAMRAYFKKWKDAHGDKPHSDNVLDSMVELSAPVAGMIKWTVQKQGGGAPSLKSSLDNGLDYIAALVEMTSAFVERKIAEGLAQGKGG